MTREIRKITSSSENRSVMEVRFAERETGIRREAPHGPGRGKAGVLKGLQAGLSLGGGHGGEKAAAGLGVAEQAHPGIGEVHILPFRHRKGRGIRLR